MTTLTDDQDALKTELRVCAALATELTAAAARVVRLQGFTNDAWREALALAQVFVIKVTPLPKGPDLRPVPSPVEAPVERPSEDPSTRPAAPYRPGSAAAAHLAGHARGVPSRIAADPELEAFLLARIHSRTFNQLAQDVKGAFPPERWVSDSSIFRWWQKWKRANP